MRYGFYIEVDATDTFEADDIVANLLVGRTHAHEVGATVRHAGVWVGPDGYEQAFVGPTTFVPRIDPFTGRAIIESVF